MISGFAHLWLIDCASVPAPTVLHGQTIGPPRKAEKEESEAEAARWFQGHLLASSAENQQEQYSVLGVPSMQKPEIHGCMIGEHSKPAFYDIYFCQSGKEAASAVAFSALGVERHCGSGDAMELEFPPPSAVGEGTEGELPSVSASLPLSSLERLRFSTTRMIAGERARAHLEKYAPAALQLYNRPQRSAPASSSSSGADSPAASDNAVVCLGAMMLVSR
ncbi:hypothetical protein H4217_007391 [Coemansia sp. RSA 1939]|nr:hypothetical protein H4217_007391 [Coemansia sp. RSA 1939]KAJ2609727.1 hypothetical protein EV177_004328 [Coemansia sp. RSA 1804]KAJ2692012.1 hypothetical protein GGH99_002017 [Coemansia sp. RSA 1285]